MDRFQEMQVFIRIAERGSFTRAADDLQIPRATVTNLIKRMEERLGTRLLERTTRTVRLTHDGEAFYRRCVRLVADMEEAEGSFHDVAPKGLLRVNVQGTLAKHFVMPALPDFVAQYPGIELHIGEDDRLVDLVREGIDCVLRAGTLQDSSMVGRRVASMPQVTVASPAYLAQFGEPATLQGLKAHRAVNYISSGSGTAVADGIYRRRQRHRDAAFVSRVGHWGGPVHGLRHCRSWHRPGTQIPGGERIGCGKTEGCTRRFSRRRRCLCQCCIRKTVSFHHGSGYSHNGYAIFLRRLAKRRRPAKTPSEALFAAAHSGVVPVTSRQF